MTGSTDAILTTVRREIERRRALLDASTDLGEVTIRVKMHAGTGFVKAVVWEEERVCRTTAPRVKEASDTIRT